VENRETNTYEDGTHVWENDHYADGTADVRKTWTYDAYGNLVTYELDNGADGSLDLRTTYLYTSDGECP